MLVEHSGGAEVFQLVEKNSFKSSAFSLSELASIPSFSSVGMACESLLIILKVFQKSLLLKVFSFPKYSLFAVRIMLVILFHDNDIAHGVKFDWIFLLSEIVHSV